MEVLGLEDKNPREVVHKLRHLLPGFFPPDHTVKKLKKEYWKELFAIHNPTPTSTGLQIDPFALHETLQFVYPFLPVSQWWKIYGDGRTFGKRRSTMVGISPSNNKIVLFRAGWQSTN